MTATAIEFTSLAGFKRLVRPGTVLVCVHNTYRPELTGSTRTVLKVQTNGYYWRTDATEKDKRSFSDYPKAMDVTEVAGDEIEWAMFPGSEKHGHHRLRMRVAEVGPEVTKQPRSEKVQPLPGDEVTFTDCETAHQYAERKARYSHRSWLVWKDTAGTYHAARLVAEPLRKAIADHAESETGRWIVTKYQASDGWRCYVGPNIARVYLANLEAGHSHD